MNNHIKKTSKTSPLRLIVIFVSICILFFILLAELYNLQIVQGEFLKNQVIGTISKTVQIDAPRGNIYDKFGRPLAINQSSFTVNIDPSIIIQDRNDVILRTINTLIVNNENIIDNFPISSEKPYTFLFNGSEKREETWKNDMNIPTELNAEQSFNYLRNKHSGLSVSHNLSDEDARKILLVSTELYKKRFAKFMTIPLAYDVKQQTISAIEENASEYIGIYIDVQAKRIYPAGDSFSHILGYIRNIDSDELKNYNDKGHTQYSLNDIVGKEGIEKSFELTLNGIDGTSYYEVDDWGRKVNENKELSVAPISGNDVFLTIDSKLNEVVYTAIEETLRDIIVNRLSNPRKSKISSKNIYSSMVEADTLSMKRVLNSPPNTVSSNLKSYILSKNKDAINDVALAKSILAKGVMDNKVSQKNIVLALFEQKVITADEKYIKRVKSGNISPIKVLLDKLKTLEITPYMTGMIEAPASTSVIVTDIFTGDVISSVSYPSYDNNRFVNNFDNEYFTKLNTDPTSPMINRTFTEPRAPGSNFKMITALAGLENNFITPNTIVYDKVTFKDAGRPYAKCWNHGSHGRVDLEKAIATSCNYYFYDLSYKMGIDILNDYMRQFGLDVRSGVELYELYDSSSLANYPSKISSPEYKRYIEQTRNPDISKYDLNWTAGDTIRTAIGQAYNNYTPAVLAKYIATIANFGERYSLHFLDKIKDSNGNIIKEYEPILEHKLDISDKNFEAIHEAMYQVTAGSQGTLSRAFKNIDTKIAAKTSTAQQSSVYNDHTVFSGFAPYDDPQIAITVFIPYGDSSTSPAPKITEKILEEYLRLNKNPEKNNTNSLTR